jgi:Protein of unknown function (DUF3152)
MSTKNHIKSGLTIVHLNAPELSRRTEKRVEDLDVAGEPETTKKTAKRKVGRVARLDPKFALIGAVIGLLSIGLVLLDGSSTKADSLTEKLFIVTAVPAQTSPDIAVTATPDSIVSPTPGVQAVDSGVTTLPTTVVEKQYAYKLTFQTSNKTDQAVFKTIAKETLNDKRGWPVAGLKFVDISNDNVNAESDFELILSEPEFLPAYSESCSVEYSCRVGKQVIINAKYWRESRPELKVPLLTYRQMVINHEVGHWLGLDHVDCPGVGQLAPVMQQQSIALNGCTANPWPLEGEVSLVSKPVQ